MGILKEILTEMLLTEATKPTPSDIKYAVENNLFVSMMYNDQKGGKGKSWRYIFPVYYAYGKKNTSSKVKTDPTKLYIRALQSVGSTKRGKFKWKLFRADKIVAWQNGDITLYDTLNTLSQTPTKAGYIKDLTDQIVKFNKTGDKQLGMTVARCTAFNEPNKVKPEEPQKAQQRVQAKAPKVQVQEPKVQVAPQTPIPQVKQPTYVTKQQVKQEPTKTQNTIDISNSNNYIQNKDTIEAPNTEPVTKMAVNNPTTQTTPSNQFNNGGYITKDEVKEEPSVDDQEEVEESPLTEVFNKMLTRWANLYKD